MWVSTLHINTQNMSVAWNNNLRIRTLYGHNIHLPLPDKNYYYFVRACVNKNVGWRHARRRWLLLNLKVKANKICAKWELISLSRSLGIQKHDNMFRTVIIHNIHTHTWANIINHVLVLDAVFDKHCSLV